MIPFNKSDQLTTLPPDPIPLNTTLPGYPRISLDNHQKVHKFLESQFRSRDLERIAPKLWWMSKHDSASISPLHRQRVKGREIIITEDPKLHLVWIYNRIFVKPIPEYLFSWMIWERFIVPAHLRSVENNNSSTGLLNGNARIGNTTTSTNPLSNHSNKYPKNSTNKLGQNTGEDEEAEMLYKSTLGFLRTYHYLIQHPTDFHIAHSLHLLPEHITYHQFCTFTSLLLDNISDSKVSERYTYGEIRLTRLNFYGKFFLGKRYFQRVESQYGHYFARFYGPLLFIFGILSVMLSALQVEVTLEQVGVEKGGPPWRAFRFASRGLSIAALVGLAVLVGILVFLFLEKFGKEWWFALREHHGWGNHKVGHARRGLAEKKRGGDREAVSGSSSSRGGCAV